jgi:hypothetical protein
MNALAFYNAGVAAVYSEVVGLGPVFFLENLWKILGEKKNETSKVTR